MTNNVNYTVQLLTGDSNIIQNGQFINRQIKYIVSQINKTLRAPQDVFKLSSFAVVQKHQQKQRLHNVCQHMQVYEHDAHLICLHLIFALMIISSNSDVYFKVHAQVYFLFIDALFKIQCVNTVNRLIQTLSGSFIY